MRLNIKRGSDWSKFDIEGRMTLLEALYRARARDPSLRFRSSCGAGMCGSCAVQCDGKPVLACKTELGEGEHWVEPLPGFEVIQDLEVNKKRLFDEQRELMELMPSRLDSNDWDMLSKSDVQVNPLVGCISCGICTSGCTTRELDWGARTRIEATQRVFDFKERHDGVRIPPPQSHRILKGIYGGMRSLPERSHALYRHMLVCSACGRCEEFCPKGIKNKVFALELTKERMIERFAMPVHEKLLGNIPTHNSYGEPHDARLSWLLGSKLPEKAEVAIFFGCSACYRTQESALAIVKILRWMGVPFAVCPDEWCCGSPYLRAGIGQQMKLRHMPHNVEVLANTGAKVVLTPCAGCFRTFNKDYPVYYGELPFKVQHIIQFIADRVRAGLELPRVSMRATFHDSCHMGRGMGEYEAPRTVIKAMGIELVEMEFNRENSHCCGGGGGLKSGFPDLALGIAHKRLAEASQTRTDAILTACVFCTRNLSDGAQAAKQSTRVLNIETLLAEQRRNLIKPKDGGT